LHLQLGDFVSDGIRALIHSKIFDVIQGVVQPFYRTRGGHLDFWRLAQLKLGTNFLEEGKDDVI